jgi:hypothetical protein
MLKNIFSVHSIHCCPTHGCKYGLDVCTVALGIEPGQTCELCEAEKQTRQEFVQDLCRDAETSGAVLHKVVEEFRGNFSAYLCACDTAGLDQALTSALKTAIVSYNTTVLKVPDGLSATQNSNPAQEKTD